MTREQLAGIFPDAQTIDMLCDLWDVMQAWDDAEDGEIADHSDAYRKAMINLPNNPLYFSCQIPLLVSQAYYDWQAANQFERKGIELHKAYMLRAGWYRIVISVVHFIHGTIEAERLAPVVWSIYGETFEDYKREMICQIQSQER